MFRTLTRLFRPRPTPETVQFRPADNRKVHPDERRALREWLDSPITKRALDLVESQQMSVIRCGTSGTVEERRYAKETRLTQLQGWNSYRNTLLGLRYTPDEIKQFLEETYPDQP